MTKLGQLVARAEISDTLLRYARACDRRDWEALRHCFHADFQDEHGEYSGGVDGFINWVSRRHAAIPFAMHFIGNMLIEFIDEKIAAVETYWVTMRRTQSEAGEVDAEIIGRYLDRFECRDGTWKIACRKVVYDSSRFVPSTHRPPIAGILGRRDRSDASYAFFSSQRE
jgi:3-phenylpropionate/cinnamic acid dioxygenase small subunit